MPETTADLAALADALERAMRDVGAWSMPAPPLRPFRAPFAMDAMPFEHWLQLVLVPRMRELGARGAPAPPRSGLAAHAVREFDGRDDLDPLIDALRAIDDACPAPPTADALARRRLVASVALLAALGAWAGVALWAAVHASDAATGLFPATVIQTYTGSVVPDANFRPLRITVSAAVARDGTLRPAEGELLALRSLATMSRGPTAPFRFLVKAPPIATHIVDWLANLGATRGPAAEHAAAEALAVVTAVAAAHTRDDLVTGVTKGAAVTPDPALELESRTPNWVTPLVTVVVFLAGAAPITAALLRFVGRR